MHALVWTHSASGSLRSLSSKESVQTDPDLRWQKRVVLQQFVEGVPHVTLPLTSAIKHPEERFHHLIVESAYAKDVVSYTVVLVITSQGSVQFVNNGFRLPVVHPLQLLPYFLQLLPELLLTGFPLYSELAISAC